jgi:hypothetical protein
MRQRPDDSIQNLIEALANIFAQKPQHMISVLLEQNILAPITAVSLGIDAAHPAGARAGRRSGKTQRLVRRCR